MARVHYLMISGGVSCFDFVPFRGYRFLFLLGIFLAQCTVQGPREIIVLQPGQVFVEKGETIYSVAQKYHVPVRDIISKNGLSFPFLLREGQILLLPNKSNAKKNQAQKRAAPGPHLIPQRDAAELPKDIEWTDLGSGSKKEETSSDVSQQETLDPQLLEEARKEALHEAEHKAAKQTKDEKASIEKPVSKPKPLKNDGVMSFSSPVSGRIVRGFGHSGSKKSHGIYFEAPTQAPICAAHEGQILFVGDELEKGQHIVVIQHANGWLSAYAPLKIKIKQGQKVKKGDIIGESTGKEVYFELRKDRKVVNPSLYLH